MDITTVHNNKSDTFQYCQLKYLYAATYNIRMIDKVIIFFKRAASAYSRRISKWREIAYHSPYVIDNQIISARPHTNFKTGDLVEVLPLNKIKMTLNEEGYCDRVLFLEGMARYAEKKLRVMKVIDYMYDERTDRIVRLKNLIILRDAICDSKGLYSKEGCGRCCFYFWKDQWLRKVDK